MSARAEIFTSNSEPKPALPLQAVLVNEDLSASVKEYYVFVYEDGVARRRNVEVGISDDQYQEIRAGLNPGERVITGPDRTLRNLEDGDAVSESAAPGDTTVPVAAG